MAGSPQLKVYSCNGEYIASCKYSEDAAALVALNGDGATIRLGHKVILWREGREDQPAAESYDFVTATLHERRTAILERTHTPG